MDFWAFPRLLSIALIPHILCNVQPIAISRSWLEPHWCRNSDPYFCLTTSSVCAALALSKGILRESFSLGGSEQNPGTSKHGGGWGGGSAWIFDFAARIRARILHFMVQILSPNFCMDFRGCFQPCFPCPKKPRTIDRKSMEKQKPHRVNFSNWTIVQKHSQKFMMMKLEVSENEWCGGFFSGRISWQFLLENSLKICHQNFTTFFTLKFTISQEICHLALRASSDTFHIARYLDTCSDSIAALFVLVFMRYRTIIAQMCLCESKYQGGGIAPFWGSAHLPEKVSRHMGYRSDSIAKIPRYGATKSPCAHSGGTLAQCSGWKRQGKPLKTRVFYSCQTP